MIRRAFAAILAVALSFVSATAQSVPTPLQHFGFELGQDRKLADWTALTSYYEKLAQTSQRVSLDTLGTTTKGRPFVMLTITSPENHARLDELHDVQMKLADPRRVSGPEELEDLLDRGRTVVLITHGIHATEVGGSQTAARLAWKMAQSRDPKILQILDNVIFLQIPSLNPDGLQWVVDWYNRHVGTEYEAAPLPWLYQFYVGHDNNRDWYAFTQDETVHTIRGAHNAWHPQIVHDIHQMGSNGARIFFPPYIEPWEPNIDPALTSAVNQLGAYMAAELTAQGKKGVVVNAQYDAFTPARAYQHYHGGARILSETASARLATPTEVAPDALGPGRGFDASRRSWNFPAPWPGGPWGLPNIVDYMESGALALLSNAARNRRFWLENFYGIGERAVAKWESWPEAWIIPAGQDNATGLAYVLRILTMGDVEVHRASAAFSADGFSFPAGSWVIPMRQPYAAFAQTMLEVQRYPDLRAYPGGPPLRPYDVTAHTLPYLMDVEAVAVSEAVDVTSFEAIDVPDFRFRLPDHLRGEAAPRVAMYKSWQEPMEAGWTRWLFDRYGMRYDTLHDADIRGGGLVDRYDVIVLQAQDSRSIVGGFPAGRVPPAYSGGLGDSGVEALRSFVLSGGRLVAVEESVDFVTDLFDLEVANSVEDLPDTDFYIPGSILRLELDPASPLARGTDPESVAWYWRSSRAFDVQDPRARVAARYGSGDPLLSGWVLGGDRLEGRPAIVEADVGQGSVVLFGFQPNYRAQTVATWPLLFNALGR
jgi:murein tripeptide amidase MpaA